MLEEIANGGVRVNDIRMSGMVGMVGMRLVT